MWVAWAAAVAVVAADSAVAANRGRMAREWDPGEVCEVGSVPSEDQCRYVQEVESCSSASWIDYLEIAYCDMSGNLGAAFVALIAWLAFLFINLVLVVDSRIVPNINTVAKCLGMSDSLAGMTLLALGNGAADIFSAVAAVNASKDGANFAISGLLGGGLYVVAVVAGVIAHNFEPEITMQRVGSDAGWYMIALASVALVASDKQFRLWECIIFIVIYCTYVVYSLVAERIEAANSKKATVGEQTALLSGPAGTNPTFDYSDEAESATQPAKSGSHTNEATVTPNIWTPSAHDGTWADTFRRVRDELFKIENESWGEKPLIFKVVTLIQVPAHVILIFANPVVIYDDRGKTWDRNRHVLLSLFMLPFVVIVFDEDTFYSNNAINLPSIIVATAVGVLVAIVTRVTSSVSDPPRYQGGFAGMGFLVALTCIYSISDEVVAVLTAAGYMLSISPSMLGMTVLGIGNGTCDLVANYLMAKAGYATTALAAVYAGPMFNLMFGLGVAGIAGFIKYGEGLPVVPELQLYLGVIFIVISLTLGVVFSSMQRFTRTHAYIFYGVYTAFLIVTISVNLA
eukprot:m.81738 g.81738  ORF g.81738 m.81738 type:complete len:571 (+) comp11029_c0_seq2:179-1891(+)